MIAHVDGDAGHAHGLTLGNSAVGCVVTVEVGVNCAAGLRNQEVVLRSEDAIQVVCRHILLLKSNPNVEQFFNQFVALGLVGGASSGVCSAKSHSSTSTA